MPHIAETDEEVENCFDVLSERRDYLKRSEFLSLVRDMESEGYRMAYVQEGGKVVAVAGYRIFTNFYMGKHLYVDDLVTAQCARSNGHGGELIEWLRGQAKAAGCKVFDLDSGVQRGRAHKFYFNHGFTVASYHFYERLDSSEI